MVRCSGCIVLGLLSALCLRPHFIARVLLGRAEGRQWLSNGPAKQPTGGTLRAQRWAWLNRAKISPFLPDKRAASVRHSIRSREVGIRSQLTTPIASL